MQKAHDFYPECPEAFIVGLARTGDRNAFAELVRRRQSGIRHLMRRCCNDDALADDLAQQVFLKVWLSLRTLKKPRTFNAWLKRLAINTWLQHLRKNDALRGAGKLDEAENARHDSGGMAMDLDSALARLPHPVRMCVVLAYHEGMTHPEITEITGLPPGTVKSHIRRGAQRLQELLSDYGDQADMEKS